MKSIKITSLLIGIAFLVTACGGSNKTVEGEQETRTTNVKVQTLQKTSVARNLSFSAVLEAYEKVAIAPAIPGRITKIAVEVGTQVSAGQLLVQMDRSSYDQAKVQFDNLAVDYKRVSKLNESDNISKQQYDQTKAAYEATKTQVENLQTNTFLRAPFSGVIESKNFEDGELFNGGTSILSLVQINNLKAYISVPETYFPQMKEGTKVAVTSEIYADTTFEGVIEIIYPTINPATHTFQVQVKIPNAKKVLRPGMYISNSISFGNVQTTIVPYQAVLKLQGANDRYVFVNNNGVAKRVSVQLGQRFDDQVEIISDEIQDGDELVVLGQAKLIDGAPINIEK